MLETVDTTAPELRGPILMNQDWLDLTYVHWSLDPDRVAALLPAGTRPDTFEGQTYLGLVPFRMRDAGFGRGGRVPWLGTFLETNLRLYSVDDAGRRGVVFLTLDCQRAAVVAGARCTLGLPYRWARMTYARTGSGHRYRSAVRGGNHPWLDLEVEVGEAAAPDPLDEFLSARWGLHTGAFGRTLYVPNAHPPWPLYRARVAHLRGTLLADAGFGDLLHREPDHVAFSPGVHTEFGLPGPASRPREGRDR
ncbi:MAG: YqjF family protein [Sporichthyaceae bacterium]